MFILKCTKKNCICPTWKNFLIIIIIIKFKTYKKKTPVGETGCLRIFWDHYLVSPALHPGFSDPSRPPPALSSTPTQGYLFFECLGIQFFNSLTCDSGDTMPRQRPLTLLPGEVEDFSRCDRHFKHVPPFIYLIYLSSKELYVLGPSKRFGYLAMKYYVSYEVWTLFTIGYYAKSSILLC